MTPDEVRAVIHELPGVEEVNSQGPGAFKVRGRMLTRLGVRIDPFSLMIYDVGSDEREMLIAADPEVFHTAPHYESWGGVLARIGPMQADVLRGFLARRFRRIAGRDAVKAWEAGG